MPSITITSDSIQVHVDFNGYAATVDYNDASFRRKDISVVDLAEDNLFVRVKMANGEKFDISFDNTVGALTVGTVDAIAPTSNEDLRNKINAIVL
jgi:hypothetical protein